MPHHDWENIRDQAGAVLLKRLQRQGAGEGEAETIEADWYDHDAIWQPRNYRQALREIDGMSNADLLTLYVQASENAYLHEGEPMESRWRKVVIACRDEIARRVSHSDTAEDASTAHTELAQRQKDSAGLGEGQEKGRERLTPQRSIPEQAQDVMASWRDLAARRGKADSYGDRLRIEREMKELAQRVRDNPEIERVLAQAAKAQGGDMKGRTFAQEMEKRIGMRERERGRDLER